MGFFGQVVAAGFFGGMFFVLFFSYLFWFKFFGGGLETNFLFGALTKIMLRLFFAFLVAAVDMWIGVAFSFLVGDFLSFLFLGGLFFVFWLRIFCFLFCFNFSFLCIRLFYGFYNL